MDLISKLDQTYPMLPNNYLIKPIFVLKKKLN